MDKYELVIEDCVSAYILDKEENRIIALCSIKRPDLGFEKLHQLIQEANNYIPMRLAIEESAEKCAENIKKMKENPN